MSVLLGDLHTSAVSSQSCHAIDLPFVFGTHAESGLEMLVGKGAEADALAEAVMDAWIAFARSGDPGHEGLPDWPSYDTGARTTMILGPECRAVERPGDAERAVWDALL